MPAFLAQLAAPGAQFVRATTSEGVQLLHLFAPERESFAEFLPAARAGGSARAVPSRCGTAWNAPSSPGRTPGLRISALCGSASPPHPTCTGSTQALRCGGNTVSRRPLRCPEVPQPQEGRWTTSRCQSGPSAATRRSAACEPCRLSPATAEGIPPESRRAARHRAVERSRLGTVRPGGRPRGREAHPVPRSPHSAHPRSWPCPAASRSRNRQAPKAVERRPAALGPAA